MVSSGMIQGEALPPFESGDFSDAGLVFCERFTEQSSIWNLTQHQHSFIELLYFLEGGARIHGKQDDLTLSVFDLIVYPENYLHLETVDLSQHQEIVCLGIELPRRSGLTHLHRLSDLDRRLRWLFIEIHAVATSGYTNRDPLLNHLVPSLLHYISMALESHREIDDPISRVIHYLHENLACRITVDELARLANCSTSYLDRRFKERTGSTPIRYLESIRLETAARLLARHDKDIAGVAGLIGFDDPKYFSRRFATHFGVSPSRYVKERRPS